MRDNSYEFRLKRRRIMPNFFLIGTWIGRALTFIAGFILARLVISLF